MHNVKIYNIKNIKIIYKFIIKIFNNNKIKKYYCGDWGLGIGPNPQSPIPNPQSPIPIIFFFNVLNYIKFFYYIIIKLK